MGFFRADLAYVPPEDVTGVLKHVGVTLIQSRVFYWMCVLSVNEEVLSKKCTVWTISKMADIKIKA